MAESHYSRSRQRQYRDYIDAVVERDVADITPVAQTGRLADSRIACALRRFTEDTFAIDHSPQALRGLLESFVLNEIQRAIPLQDADYRLYHRRSADQREIDILIDGGPHLVCVEVKASATVSRCKELLKLRLIMSNKWGIARRHLSLLPLTH